MVLVGKYSVHTHQVVGRGAHGVVYVGYSNERDEKVAVKAIPVGRISKAQLYTFKVRRGGGRWSQRVRRSATTGRGTGAICRHPVGESGGGSDEDSPRSHRRTGGFIPGLLGGGGGEAHPPLGGWVRQNEIDLLKSLQDRHIVQYKDHEETRDHLYIMMECAPCHLPPLPPAIPRQPFETSIGCATTSPRVWVRCASGSWRAGRCPPS